VSDRASFLAGSAALGATLAARSVSAQPAPGPRIDVHHHYVPPAYITAVGAAQLAQPILSWTPAKSLDDMDRAGVTKAMLSITTPGLSFGFPDAAARLARACNEYAADLSRSHPGRFGMFAALPLPDVKASLAEATYALDTLKADGVGVFSSYDGHIWLGSSALDPLFAELDRRAAIVFVHPTSNACCAGMLPNVEDAIIEYQTDTTRAIANYLFNGAALKFPNVRIIFSHAGGTMPYLIGRFLAKARDPRVAQNLPGGVLPAITRFYYDTAQSANVEAMTALNKLVPSAHILFGTDFPYGAAVRDVPNLQAAGLSPSDLRGVFAANAMALFAQRPAG
jgi:predicted TIM-barrel fold metal-dependent hydrolase